MKRPNLPLLSATSLNGTQVENNNREHIGEIFDLMIDTDSAEVSYAVVSVATGFLNLGSKYFAVPLEALQVDTANRKLILDITKERLENAPGFDKDNWPSGPQDAFVESVYGYYNLKRSGRRFDPDYRDSAIADDSIYASYQAEPKPQKETQPLEQSITRDRRIAEEAEQNQFAHNPADEIRSTRNRNLEGVQGSRENLRFGRQDKISNEPKSDSDGANLNLWV